MNKNRKIALGIVLLAIAFILFARFNNLFVTFSSSLGFVDSNSMIKTGEDSGSSFFQITAIPEGGVYIPSQYASSSGVNTLTGTDFGIIQYSPGFLGLQSGRYNMTNIKLEGLRAQQRNGDPVDSTDYNLGGYCDVNEGSSIVQCKITKGDLWAIVNGQKVGTETVNDFYGITKTTAQLTVLKQGVQCTPDQLSNCGDKICINNQCVNRSGDVLDLGFQLNGTTLTLIFGVIITLLLYFYWRYMLR